MTWKTAKMCDCRQRLLVVGISIVLLQTTTAVSSQSVSASVRLNQGIVVGVGLLRVMLCVFMLQ